MAERNEYAIDHPIAEGMEALLAKIIEKYPILYDKEHKHRFQSAYPKEHENAWTKISDELNLDVDSCKSLWSCMKQKFIKYRKRLDKQEPVSAWPVYEILHKWLDRHVKKRRTRHDYFIRQMKTQQRTAIMQASKRTNDCGGGGGDDEDDIDGVDDEWTDLLEDKDTMVKIQLKRKSSGGADLSEDADASTHHHNHLQQATHNDSKQKKKFKIEVVSEQGTEIYNDNDLFGVTDVDNHPESASKDCEIVVLEKNGCSSQISPQIEVIELKEVNELKAAAVDAKSISVNIENQLMKLEQFLSNCVRLVDRYAAENASADSNDVFGKYIASMVRELPAERRIKIRMEILQYTSELIAKELPNAWIHGPGLK